MSADHAPPKFGDEQLKRGQYRWAIGPDSHGKRVHAVRAMIDASRQGQWVLLVCVDTPPATAEKWFASQGQRVENAHPGRVTIIGSQPDGAPITPSNVYGSLAGLTGTLAGLLAHVDLVVFDVWNDNLADLSRANPGHPDVAKMLHAWSNVGALIANGPSRPAVVMADGFD